MIVFVCMSVSSSSICTFVCLSFCRCGRTTSSSGTRLITTASASSTSPSSSYGTLISCSTTRKHNLIQTIRCWSMTSLAVTPCPLSWFAGSRHGSRIVNFIRDGTVFAYNIGAHAQWFRVNLHPWQWSGNDERPPIAYSLWSSLVSLLLYNYFKSVAVPGEHGKTQRGLFNGNQRSNCSGGSIEGGAMAPPPPPTLTIW